MPNKTAQAASNSLLFDLDQRQNQVLTELDSLNDRIEALLSEWTASRDEENSPDDRLAA
ncbi:MAG: hypothetical protein KDA87_17485 [Planctomycetales bacterium]|nr:hypothetical protein [Planctomycetales bacterium]